MAEFIEQKHFFDNKAWGMDIEKDGIKIFTTDDLQHALVCGKDGKVICKIDLDPWSGEGGGGTLIVKNIQ